MRKIAAIMMTMSMLAMGTRVFAAQTKANGEAAKRTSIHAVSGKVAKFDAATP